MSKVWNQVTVQTFAKAQDAVTRRGRRNADFLSPEVFLEAVYEPYQRHFAGHAGPFVFEFQAIGPGSGVGPSRFADLLDQFFSALPREGPYAVEIRNEDFLTPMYFAVLREHGVAHVFNSWTRMPAHRRSARSAGLAAGPLHRGPRAASAGPDLR